MPELLIGLAGYGPPPPMWLEFGLSLVSTAMGLSLMLLPRVYQALLLSIARPEKSPIDAFNARMWGSVWYLVIIVMIGVGMTVFGATSIIRIFVH